MKLSHYNLRFRLFWQYITGKFRRRKFRSVESLDPDILKQVQAEAAVLRSLHGVEVRNLRPGETPDIPKPVKPE